MKEMGQATGHKITNYQLCIAFLISSTYYTITVFITLFRLVLTTVEGLIARAVMGLEQDQPVRRVSESGEGEQGKRQGLLKSDTALGAAIAYFLTLSVLLRQRSVPMRQPILIING